MLHKVQPPQYHKHQVTNLKPAAGVHRGTMRYNVHPAQFKLSIPQAHLCTKAEIMRPPEQIAKAGRARTEMELAAEHPAPLRAQLQMVPATASPSSVPSCSPGPAQPARKQQHHPVSPAGGCVQTITFNKASGLWLLVRE